MELLIQLAVTIVYAIGIGLALVLATFFAALPSGSDRGGAQLERNDDEASTHGALQRPVEGSVSAAA